MTANCLVCHAPIVAGAPSGVANDARSFALHCGNCHAIFRVEVTTLRGTTLTPEELATRMNTRVAK